MSARCFAVLLAIGGAIVAQAGVDTERIVTERRLRDTVAWLAADERRGRDTGSPELAEAAAWIAARFAAAGLEQVVEGSWFHEFQMAGVRVDSTAVTLKLARRAGSDVQRFEFAADADVRQLTPSDAIAGADEECTVARHDDAVLQRLLGAASARRPIVVEIDMEHPLWTSAGGAREVVGKRRQASRPVFLVRRGLLPEASQRDRDAIWQATWSVAEAPTVEVPQVNVVGRLRGRELPDEYVVVSAHYDHIGVGRGVDGDAIYNGADDNATGTAAVLLLAEALAAAPPRRSLVFACFAAEERGLQGSAAFCAAPPLALDRVVANLNLEMLGRPEADKVRTAWVTGAELSDFAALAGAALERLGIGLTEHPLAGQLFFASDNLSFARRGIVAHTISAGTLHPDYHQPGDEVDKLDLAHMTAVVRALVGVVRELADRPEPPVWSQRGRELLDRLRR